MQNNNPLPAVKQSQAILNGVEQKRWLAADRAKLAVVMSQVFDVQKQYGKTAQQLETLIEGFCWALGKYPVEVVLEGIRQYIMRKPDIPTPADIANIIDPQAPEWKPNPSYYVTLKELHKQHGPYGLTLDEIEYIAKYENHMQQDMRASRG